MELKLEFGGQSCGVSIFLPNGTKPEKKAADELKSMMELTGTVERMKESGVFSAEKEHSVIKAAVTPDFHKGAGIPIGTVLMTGWNPACCPCCPKSAVSFLKADAVYL